MHKKQKKDRETNNGDYYIPAQFLKQILNLSCFSGFLITKMVEDGSCLFRAVADQVFGDQEMHPSVRRNCMDYVVSFFFFFFLKVAGI